MNYRKTLTIWETKLEKHYQQNGICTVCKEPVSVTDGQLGHKIPQSKWALARYGPKVIHHPKNMDLVHPECNDAVSISNHPIEMEKLAALIGKEKEE